eukprot:3671608-Rhodomonas_salina.1
MLLYPLWLLGLLRLCPVGPHRLCPHPFTIQRLNSLCTVWFRVTPDAYHHPYIVRCPINSHSFALTTPTHPIPILPYLNTADVR